MSCGEKVTVDPPARSELQFTTHVGCCEQNFWFKMPHCIGVSMTGTFLCCTRADLCRLKQMSDVDNFQDGHGISQCCSLKQLKAVGFKDCVWMSSSGRATMCFICEQKSEYECKFPTTCCKCAVQELCCDFRIALPPDEDVPIGCSICGKWFKGEAGQGWKSAPGSQYMGGKTTVVAAGK